MRKRLFHVDVGKLLGRATAKRSTASSQHEARDLAIQKRRRTQTLVHRTVLAVDGHQLGARGRAQRLYDRSAGNQTLLVGERQPTTELQRAHRDRQSREADNSVDNHVCGFHKVGEIVDNLCERQRSGDLRAPRGVCDRDDLRTKLECLAHQRIDGTPDAKCDNLVAIAFGADNIERLLAN